MDMLTDEIEQLKKIVSELMLNNAMKSGLQSQKRLPSTHSNQTRGTSVKWIQPAPLNFPKSHMNDSTLSFADKQNSYTNRSQALLLSN